MAKHLITRTLPLTARQAEILQVLHKCNGNIAAAARTLNLDRKTVRLTRDAALEKIKKSGQKPPMPPPEDPLPRPKAPRRPSLEPKSLELQQNPISLPQLRLEQIPLLGRPHPDQFEHERITEWRSHRINAILAEMCRRRYEAINLYQPLPHLEEYHRSRAHERILRSGVRAGKTLCAAAEFARGVLEKDPHGKYPVGRGGTAVIVGYDQDHVGKVIYPMLFEPGAFQVIRDEHTRRWRCFNPELSWDRKHAIEANPAPPLIPRRFIKSWSWETKSEHVFSVCRLHNGWEIWAYSSRAKPPQGFRADIYWFDEDLDDPSWIDEAIARIADGKNGGGRLTWSARPHSKNVALLRMSQRAAQQKRERPDDPDIVEWQFNRKLNAHVDKAANERLSRSLRFQGEDTQKMMDLGEYTIDEWKVFPELSRSVHEVPLTAPELKTGSLPRSWTRFAVIDPGVQVCAVLFAAVPPPDFGDFVYLEDELYIQNATDALLAKGMKTKIAGRRYYAWIIDKHGSHSKWVTGRTIAQQYEDAFEEHGIKSDRTGYGFFPGCSERTRRVARVHRWLQVREDGTTKLRFVEGKLPNFWEEAETYHRTRQRDPLDSRRWVTTDDPDDRGPVHTQVCLQYLVMCPAVRYHQHVSEDGVREPSSSAGVHRYLREKQDRKRNKHRREGSGYVNLGPGRY